MTAPVAIIPARGGSKRIPQKNIRPFLGVPLLARTVDRLQQSGVFARVIVSTDDAAIAAMALSAGAEVPFMRPAALADDHTATVPVIAHAITVLEEQGDIRPVVCCVYPAAVFVEPDDFHAALEML